MAYVTASSTSLTPHPRVLFVSTFVPRECGLATFTEDLMDAATQHGAQCAVVAMERPGTTLTYDKRVIGTICENRRNDYRNAAQLINDSGFDVVSLQHEFGIFGGVDCDHVLELLGGLTIPVVTTLHTVLRNPTAAMRRNLRAVIDRSDAVMVMNGLAIKVLATVYGVNPAKVTMVHHGAPEAIPCEAGHAKQRLGFKERRVISTFGLLSAGKGLEYVIQAMPAIAASYPDACYAILGQTHPVVKQQEGETYRESLKTLAHDLGVGDHVVFVDTYFSKPELLAYLHATDIYLTPYLNMEQVTSGTLAYAMACGRPLVSTPYLHAQFLLDNGRGILIDPHSPPAIAEACLRLFDNPELMHNMEQCNRRYGRTMTWPYVGREFLDLCARITRRAASLSAQTAMYA